MVVAVEEEEEEEEAAGEDPQGERRGVVKVAGTGLRAGGDEVAGRLWETEWDGGATHRGARRLLTTTQSRGEDALCQAALGPCWVLYTRVHTVVHKYHQQPRQTQTRQIDSGQEASSSTSQQLGPWTAVWQHHGTVERRTRPLRRPATRPRGASLRAKTCAFSPVQCARARQEEEAQGPLGIISGLRRASLLAWDGGETEGGE